MAGRAGHAGRRNGGRAAIAAASAGGHSRTGAGSSSRTLKIPALACLRAVVVAALRYGSFYGLGTQQACRLAGDRDDRLEVTDRGDRPPRGRRRVVVEGSSSVLGRVPVRAFGQPL